MTRGGVYIANFQTADKLSVEAFPLPAGCRGVGDPALPAAVVRALLNPGAEAGGDSRLEMPPPSRVKFEVKDAEDGKAYLYLAYPSNTTTRSGYEIRRKNLAVSGVKNGVVYALGASARSDQFTPAGAAQLQHIVDTFRVR